MALHQLALELSDGRQNAKGAASFEAAPFDCAPGFQARLSAGESE